MESWRSRRVLITGGLGFIGSNLAHHLVERGADVTVFDARLPHLGSNPSNLDGIRDEVTIKEADVRDDSSVFESVEAADVVYHCAAQNDRSFAQAEPQVDVDINCTGTMNVLEAARACEHPPRVVYTSSLAVYGRAVRLPVDETTLPRAIDLYGANKYAAEQYCRIYDLHHDVPTTVCRLPNVYGPRSPTDKGYAVQSIFIATAVRDETLTVFEPGTILRDLVHVDDVVDALLQLGTDDRAVGESYVLGSGEGMTLVALANTIVEIAGTGNVELVPWPDEWKQIKRGDIYTDPSKLRSELGWKQSIDLETGLRETIEFYRDHRAEYL